jgi:hypothetical protein
MTEPTKTRQTKRAPRHDPAASASPTHSHSFCCPNPRSPGRFARHTISKTNLKSYAPQARKDFIAAVTARAHLLGLDDQYGQLKVAPSQTQGDVTVIAGKA